MPWWNAKSGKRKKPNGFGGGWNKGLTKATDDRVRVMYTDRTYVLSKEGRASIAKHAKNRSIKSRKSAGNKLREYFSTRPFECECKICNRKFYAKGVNANRCDNCLKSRLCKCGCERITKPGCTFVHGHNNTGIGSRPRTSKTLRRAYRVGIRKPVHPTHVKQSDMEVVIARFLHDEGLKIKLQYRIPTTRYTADIYIPDVKLIVEIDAHPYHIAPENSKYRMRRYRRINSLGFRQIHLRQKQLARRIDYCISKVCSKVKRLKHNKY